MSSEITPATKRNFLSIIFISPAEPRLRAGWRLLLQTFIMILLGIIVSFGASALQNVNGQFAFILNQVLNLIVITGSVYIARRWLDKRSFESLGLKLDRQTGMDILVGIGITFVQMGFIFVVMLGLGWLTFTGFAWNFDPIGTVVSNVLTFFAGFVIVGWNEELLSRGYHMQTIASGFNLFWGVVISSTVFGLLHLGNPNATWSAQWASSLPVFISRMDISARNSSGFPSACTSAGIFSKA